MSDRTIWRYNFEVSDRVRLQMPEGALILPFCVEAKSPVDLSIWAEVDPGAEQVDRDLFVIGTGNPMPEEASTYIGSTPAGPFVWHVYV